MPDNYLKTWDLEPGSKLGFYYDSKDLLQNTTKVTFFAPNPTGGILLNNYEQNPFQPAVPHDIVAMGFLSRLPWTPSGTNIDVAAIAAALANSIVRITRFGGTEIVLEEPFSHYHDLQQMAIAARKNVFTAGALASQTTHLLDPSSALFKLKQPIEVPPNVKFNVELELDPTLSATLPAQADWDTADYGATYGLICVVQYSRPKLDDELTPLDVLNQLSAPTPA